MERWEESTITTPYAPVWQSCVHPTAFMSPVYTSLLLRAPRGTLQCNDEHGESPLQGR